MHRITASQFEAAVELDPAWAAKLTEPVEITDYCGMDASEITHLSPLLHFTGKDEDGDSASFNYCKSLKVAEGHFEGHASFSESAIEEVRNLTCGKNERGCSASFGSCASLKIAGGKFEGSVDFDRSTIEKIGGLSCGKNEGGYSATFQKCKSLKIAEGEFEGFVDFYGSAIEKIGDLSCGKNESGIRLDVENCPNLTRIPHTFDPNEVRADPELIEKLEVERFVQKRRAEIVEIEI